MTTRNSMFSRNRPPQNTSTAVTSLIAQGTCITGDISFTGSLFLDGRIDGQVMATEAGALLTVGEQGLVRGNICVPAAVIHGHVYGDVDATERLELAASARVTGDLHYRSVLVVAGAQINGRMHHRSSESEASAAPPVESDDTQDVSVPAEHRFDQGTAFSDEPSEVPSTPVTVESTNGSPADELPQTLTAPEPFLVVQPRKRGRMR